MFFYQIDVHGHLFHRTLICFIEYCQIHEVEPLGCKRTDTHMFPVLAVHQHYFERHFFLQIKRHV